MIIGDGDIASVLPERDDLLFFASGVSNSRDTHQGHYSREVKLLSEQDKTKHIVYFSTLALFYSDTRYTRHKRHMELMVKKYFQHHTIIRLGNITWGKNPHTLINFFRNEVKRGEPLDIRDEWRYMIGVDEFLHWIDMIPGWNCEMNLNGKRMKVEEVVREYVD